MCVHDNAGDPADQPYWYLDVKSKIKKLPGSSGVTRFCLREDLERVTQQRAEFLQAGDTEGLRAWGEEAKKSLEIQRKVRLNIVRLACSIDLVAQEGGDIWHYFYLTALDRSNELNEIKSERRDKFVFLNRRNVDLFVLTNSEL